MAQASGLSVSSVQRIWRAFGLQPHHAETFEFSTDPLFVEKVCDVVGLYVAPPERAIVLRVDEKKSDPGARSQHRTRRRTWGGYPTVTWEPATRGTRHSLSAGRPDPSRSGWTSS